MSKPKILLIILSIVAIILLVTFWYLFNSTQEQQSNLNTNIQVQNLETQEPIQETDNSANTNQNQAVFTPQLSEDEKAKVQLSRFVTAFVERYGSYSNQSDYENLEDLMQFMTNNLKTKTQQFVHDMRYQNKDNSVYYGITTKVLKAEIKEFEPALNKSIFNVSTQKHEMFGVSVNAKIFYQSAQVELEKVGSVWQVNNLIWQ